MQKRGQLIAIEFHYFMGGLAVGLVLGYLLTLLGSKNVLPFKIPLVCGFFLPSKKAQLGIIEMKFFLIGFFIGLILSLLLIFLGTVGVLPFKIPFAC